jgi:peptidase E
VYSGEVPALDVALARCLGPRRSLVAVPYSLDDVASADEAVAYFRAAGVSARALTKQAYGDGARLRAKVLAAGGVFLVGGNTYEFLAYARQSGLFGLLRQLEAQGGVIAAESAGSILLSPDIATAGIPRRSGDCNTPGLTRLRGMGRIPFHISPHFEPSGRYAQRDLAELQALADGSRRSVMILEDGDGFAMRGLDVVKRVGQSRLLRPMTLPAAPVGAAAVLPRGRDSRVCPRPRAAAR